MKYGEKIRRVDIAGIRIVVFHATDNHSNLFRRK